MKKITGSEEKKVLIRINPVLRDAILSAGSFRGMHGYEILEKIVHDWMKENEPKILMKEKRKFKQKQLQEQKSHSPII